MWTGTEVDALRDRIGPDPLDPRADPGRFFHDLSRRRRPIGAVLLDQSIISGIGNMYRAEILFRAGLNPQLPAKEVPVPVAQALWDDAVGLLALGVQHNRIITVDADAPGRLGRGERLNVYKRRTCRTCASDIRRGDLGGRTLYWCPTCQA